MALGMALTLVACGSDGSGADVVDDTAVAIDTIDDTASVDTEPVDTSPPLEPWQHEGPITQAAATPPTAPYFTEVTAGVGLEAFFPGVGRAQVVDLDGPLLLARDRPDGLHYDGATVFPASPALWG